MEVDAGEASVDVASSWVSSSAGGHADRAGAIATQRGTMARPDSDPDLAAQNDTLAGCSDPLLSGTYSLGHPLLNVQATGALVRAIACAGSRVGAQSSYRWRYAC